MVCPTNSEHSQTARALREEQDRARLQSRRQHDVTAWHLEAGGERISGREAKKGNPGQVQLPTFFSRLWLSMHSYRLKGGGGQQGPEASLEPLPSVRRIVMLSKCVLEEELPGNQLEVDFCQFPFLSSFFPLFIFSRKEGRGWCACP